MPEEPDEFDLVPETGPWLAAPLADFETSSRRGRYFKCGLSVIHRFAICAVAALIGIAFVGWPT